MFVRSVREFDHEDCNVVTGVFTGYCLLLDERGEALGTHSVGGNEDLCQV